MAELSERTLELFVELCDLDAGEQTRRLSRLETEDPGCYQDLKLLLEGDRLEDERLERPLAERLLGIREPAALSSDEGTQARLAGLPLSARGFERYAIGESIGAGGMGEVCAAWDPDLERKLALKRLIDPSGVRTDPSPEQLRRFLREARVTGRLDHPGIVPVHEIGLDDRGRPYFTMKLVRGKTLRAWLGDAGAVSLPRALGVLVRACEAVAYAHSKGVVHRDLKLENILVGDFGEVYVVDWGIARVLEEPEERDLRPADEMPHAATEVQDLTADRKSGAPFTTRDGTVLGTPHYMSPEQAFGRSNEIGPPSDIYSLGAVLYEVLSGMAPYADVAGHAAPRVLKSLRGGPPTPLAAAAPDAPPEVISIAERCLERDPGKRYGKVEQLTNDLRAFLEGRVVTAHATGPWVEAKKWVRRNPFAAAAALVGLLLVSGAAGLALAQANETRLERGSRDRVGAMVVRILASLQPSATRGESETESLIFTALEELDASLTWEQDAPVRSEISLALGKLLRSRGQLAEAQKLLEAEYASMKARGGADPGELGEFEASLGAVSHQLGQYEKAGRLFAEAAEASAADGLTEREHARALSDQALVVEERGEFVAAHKVHDQVLTMLQDLPDSDTDKLVAMERLAGVARKIGDYERGEELSRRVVAGREKALGADDPDTIHARHTLALQLLRSGKHEEAVALLEGVLFDRLRILGPKHQEVFQAMTNLGDGYSEVGRHEDALALYEEALEGLHDTLGAGHWNSIACMNGYAAALRAAGDVDAAVIVAEDASKVAREHLDRNHPYRIFCDANLGSLYGEVGRLDEALELLPQALAEIELQHPSDDPQLLELRGLLSEIYVKANRPKDARFQLERILEFGRPGQPQREKAMARLDTLEEH